MLQAIRPNDFRALAEAHVLLDPTAFLSQFDNIGITFRERIFYPTLAHDPDCFVWIYSFEGQLAGYVAGTKDVRTFYERLKRARPFYLFRLLLKASLKKPKLIVECFATKRRLEQSYLNQSLRVEILSLGVLPQFRTKEFEEKHGVHIAGDLFKKAVGTFRDWRVPRFKVMTTQENEVANRFYKKQGCQLVATAQPFHLPCNVFVGELSSVTQ